jgi:L-fucose isomerase-like protein
VQGRRFNTVRYSEKILQRNGISVTTVDLSEILGNANKLTADDGSVKEKLEKIHAYTNTGLTPPISCTDCKVRCGAGRLCRRKCIGCHGHSMLDIPAKKLWL